MQKQALGIDIGGGIIKRIDADADTSFQDDFVNTPPVNGAIEAINDIASRRFGAHVYLVSKCGPDVEALTMQWLNAHRFFQRSGIPPGNIRFCRERDQKAQICAGLGITDFIDDRLEVLGNLKTVTNLYLFQPRADEVARFARHLSRVHVVHSWERLREIFRETASER